MSLESFEQAPKKAILPESETQAFYGSLKSAWVVLEKVRSLSDREKAQHDPEEIEPSRQEQGGEKIALEVRQSMGSLAKMINQVDAFTTGQGEAFSEPEKAAYREQLFNIYELLLRELEKAGRTNDRILLPHPEKQEAIPREERGLLAYLERAEQYWQEAQAGLGQIVALPGGGYSVGSAAGPARLAYFAVHAAQLELDKFPSLKEKYGAKIIKLAEDINALRAELLKKAYEKS